MVNEKKKPFPLWAVVVLLIVVIVVSALIIFPAFKPFEPFYQKKWPIFVNPKYARGPSPKGIAHIFANPAYGTGQDLLMGIVPVPTNLMQWRYPSVNGFGPEDEKSVMDVNGKIGITSWQNNKQDLWGTRGCGCNNKKKEPSLKEGMLHPGVYDQDIPNEAPFRNSHVISPLYYLGEWKSRYKRDVWNDVWR